MQTDDAQIHLAKVQLGYTRIVAPISGRIGVRLVDPGNIVHAADNHRLVVINQVDPVTWCSRCPRKRSRTSTAPCTRARPLQVIAFPRDGTSALGSGRLTLVNNQIDTATGTVQLKGDVPEPGPRAVARPVRERAPRPRPRPSARSRFPRPRSTQPERRVRVGRRRRRQGTPPARAAASIQDGLAIVAGGLQAGERVVIDGQYKLQPDVNVVEVAAALQAAAPARAPARRSQPASRPTKEPPQNEHLGRVHQPPIGTSLLALAILLVGGAVFPLLPVAPLPQVDFPTIQVSASLAGRESRRRWRRTWRSRWSAISR